MTENDIDWGSQAKADMALHVLAEILGRMPKSEAQTIVTEARMALQPTDHADAQAGVYFRALIEAEQILSYHHEHVRDREAIRREL